MQIRANNKHILICLLLCSLFLTSYVSILNTNGIIYSDVFDIFSTNGRSEHSSMNDSANIGHDDYMAAADTSTELSISSIRQSQWLSAKTSLSLLTAVVSTQMTCFIYYSKLSDQAYTQLNSSIITSFLHKKDGMK